MSEASAESARLVLLIQRYLDGAFSPQEREELESLLITDPRAADLFAEAVGLEAQLAAHFRQRPSTAALAEALLAEAEGSGAEFDSAEPVSCEPLPAPVASRGETAQVFVPALCEPRDRPAPAAHVRSRRWNWRWRAAAAGAVVAACLLLLIFRGGSPAGQVIEGQMTLAGIEGHEIPLNTVARVKSGPADIQLPDGSRIELAAGSEIVLRGRVGETRQVVELRSGKGTFRVTKADAGFRVETRVASVSVVGTVFTLELQSLPVPVEQLSTQVPRDTLAVTVSEGAVRVRSGLDSDAVLSAGQEQLFFGR